MGIIERKGKFCEMATLILMSIRRGGSTRAKNAKFFLAEDERWLKTSGWNDICLWE